MNSNTNMALLAPKKGKKQIDGPRLQRIKAEKQNGERTCAYQA